MNRLLKAAVREVATHPYRTAAIAVGVAYGAHRIKPGAASTLLAIGAAGAVAHAGLHATGRMTAAEMLRWNPNLTRNEASNVLHNVRERSPDLYRRSLAQRLHDTATAEWIVSEWEREGHNRRDITQHVPNWKRAYVSKLRVNPSGGVPALTSKNATEWTRRATSQPWHEFVADYVVAATATAEGRDLLGGGGMHQIKKVGPDRYAWGVTIRGKFQPTTAPTTAQNVYGEFQRTPFKYFADKGDMFRQDAYAASRSR